MKVNSIFYFILISYIYSETNITLSDESNIDLTEYFGVQLASFIDPNNHLNFIYCTQRIINYINKELYSIGGFDGDPWYKVFEIGKNGTMIVVY